MIEVFSGQAPSENLLRIFGFSIFEPTPQKSAERMAAQLAKPGARILVYRESGGRELALIGYSAMEKLLVVDYLAVDPPSRRRGIARALVEEAIRRELPDRVELETDAGAKAFYEGIGFSTRSLGAKKGWNERFSCLRIIAADGGAEALVQ